jgi:hypothetical protein
VELFKDENSARCRQCGHRFVNPKKSFDCAQWCSYAEECTGVPLAGSLALGEGFASHLVQTIESAFPDRPREQAEALLIFQHAKELLAEESGDSRCVLAVSLLLPFVRNGAVSSRMGADVETSGELLRRMGLEEPVVGQAEMLLLAFQRSQVLDTAEYRIVRDADRLAELASRPDRHDRPPDTAETAWNTEAARKRARTLFQEP